ncbi:hAT-like transposase, RNase-H fold [Dillenia turbinata]|uniref:HAT-like transposase, RNase-H fold n=1 Tax=Dillenia turbinata TaxID=194707 RepID=A0AAN8ZF82_9MAGN
MSISEMLHDPEGDNPISVKPLLPKVKRGKGGNFTSTILSSLYVTCNAYFSIIFGTGMMIKEKMTSNNKSHADMAIRMKTKHDKYWSYIKNINHLLFVAMILDPHLKKDYVLTAISHLYEEPNAKVLEERVNDSLMRYFEHYASAHSIVENEGCTPCLSLLGIDNVESEKHTLDLFSKILGPLDFLRMFSQASKCLGSLGLEPSKLTTASMGLTSSWGAFLVLGQVLYPSWTSNASCRACLAMTRLALLCAFYKALLSSIT